MMIPPATAISSPSTDAEISSIFPCPNGWFSSFGLAARYRLYRLMNPAITLTMLSIASVRIPTELVRANARNLPPISSTEQAMIRRCTRCLISLSVLLFMFRRFFVWCGVRFAGSNDGRVARSVFREMKNSADSGIFQGISPSKDQFRALPSVSGSPLSFPVRVSRNAVRSFTSLSGSVFPTWYFAMSLTASSSVWRVPS